MHKTSTRDLQRQLRLLLDDHAIFGSWNGMGSTQSIEHLAGLGFDFVGIDLQHTTAGPLGGSSIYEQILAADAWGQPTVVRTPWADAASVMQVLDAGASGVIIPMVNTVEEAHRAVSWSKYPPLGSRSLGTVRAALADPEYTPHLANAGALCFVMIETAQALDNADQIMAVEGLDGIFIGPWDLTLSTLGRPRDAETDSTVNPLIIDLVQRARNRGLYVGTAASGGVEARQRADEGFHFSVVGGDLGYLRRGALAELADAHGRSATNAVPA
jgi:4-hydroxy-2-oxoheptanedioate aldolase